MDGLREGWIVSFAALLLVGFLLYATAPTGVCGGF